MSKKPKNLVSNAKKIADAAPSRQQIIIADKINNVMRDNASVNQTQKQNKTPYKIAASVNFVIIVAFCLVGIWLENASPEVALEFLRASLFLFIPLSYFLSKYAHIHFENTGEKLWKI